MLRQEPLLIEVDMDQPHVWYGPYVHRWTCNVENGLHVCMRGAQVNGGMAPGPHRCACGERW